MKGALTLVTVPLLALAGVVHAEEVILQCVSNADDKDIRQVTIRFDESKGEFSLAGKTNWKVRTKDGEAEVKKVEFSPDKIVVDFKRKGVLLVNVWAMAASGGRTGVLDRTLGTWTYGGFVFACERASDTDRKF